MADLEKQLAAIAYNPNITDEHLMTALRSDNVRIRREALFSKKLKTDHITHILKSPEFSDEPHGVYQVSYTNLSFGK